MTAYLQTLDIAINKPFKDHLRMEINDYIENRMVRNDRGNFVKPKLQEITKSQTAVLPMHYEHATWIGTSHSIRPLLLDMRE